MKKILATIIVCLFAIVVLIFIVGGLLSIPTNHLIGGFAGFAIAIILIWAITVVEKMLSNK